MLLCIERGHAGCPSATEFVLNDRSIGNRVYVASANILENVHDASRMSETNAIERFSRIIYPNLR